MWGADRLAVQMTGWGQSLPNYGDAVLEIGKSYHHDRDGGERVCVHELDHLRG